MGTVDQYRADLRRMDPATWPAYLTQRSGLPGPRGNIELGQAVADVGDRAVFDALIATDDEYLVFCGVVGLGAVLAAGEDPVADDLLRHAADGRWRVREGVAMALQRLGDADLPRLLDLVLRWVDDQDPLVQRAAAAAVCEPRLVRTPAAAATAVEVCRRATESLARRPAVERRREQVRTLRQGLGYCWSVAVAADPGPGLAAFAALDLTDPDIAWIVRENRKKKRLITLL